MDSERCIFNFWAVAFAYHFCTPKGLNCPTIFALQESNDNPSIYSLGLTLGILHYLRDDIMLDIRAIAG